MEILFKTLSNNRVASNNTSILSQFIISEDGLNTALEIATLQKQSVWNFLMHKVMFVALPMKKDNTDFRACTAFVVRRADGTINIWSNQYLNIEDGDSIFTTKVEAEEYADAINEENVSAEEVLAELIENKNRITARIAEINELRKTAKEKYDSAVKMMKLLDNDLEEQNEALNIINNMIDDLESQQ